MESKKKVPLQFYLSPSDRADFIRICESLDNGSASHVLRSFVKRQIKKQKDLL